MSGLTAPGLPAPAAIATLSYFFLTWPPDVETTRLSSKGQVILPKSIRAAHRWAAGVRFAVVDTPDGVLLRPLKPYAPTRVEDVVGSTGYAGPAKTLEEMEDAVARAARDRHDRG